MGADAGDCEDGRTVGEFLADIVSDAKAAGSSNDQARFQGYQVNLVIISCFTVVDPICIAPKSTFVVGSDIRRFWDFLTLSLMRLMSAETAIPEIEASLKPVSQLFDGDKLFPNHRLRACKRCISIPNRLSVVSSQMSIRSCL